METTRTLRDSRSVVLNASGNGSITFGPQQPNTRYHIKAIAVTVTSNVIEPTATSYHGTPNAGTKISGSYTGSNDQDPDVDETLWPGEIITVSWVGGDVGATATASFRGEILAGTVD